MDLKETIKNFVPSNEQEENDRELMLNYISIFDDVLTRKNKMCHFTVSAWITNSSRDKILMIYHNIYDSWSWIGGHCDGDDNLLNVALKEAKEETGLTDFKILDNNITSLEILTAEGHIKNEKYVSSHLHLNCTFLLEADENKELKIKEDENSGVKWFDINEVLRITREKKMIPIYKKLNKKLLNLK